MRKFKTTPQKKLAGMLILFVGIPLFLLWYYIFFLDNKPSTETLVILGACAILAAYFYLRYKKQINALAAATQPKQKEPAEKPVEEDLSEEELDEEVDDSLEEEQK